MKPGETPVSRIRNFAIIAHIDHGKSTLADRLLELTGTINKEDMQGQMMDTMDIERERGITIKLNTARMNVTQANGDEYVLNLIDTPGHVDFSYEVSRSLAACEGCLLVVDASQGVQAQTLANVSMAMDNNLTIIPVLNKVDLPHADPDRVAEEIENVIGIECTDYLPCSAKSGLGVPAIIDRLIQLIPPPEDRTNEPLRALIYDSVYDQYVGVVTLFRIISGTMKKGMKIRLMASNKEFQVEEIGFMIAGRRNKATSLSCGEVGYMCAQIKQVGDARVGDTICESGMEKIVQALPGYAPAVPMVFCGLFPSSGETIQRLTSAFEKLALNDAAIVWEPENSVALGQGYRCGFLGVLHMEVVKERLEREYDLDLVVTSPSVVYEVEMKNGSFMKVEFANLLPELHQVREIREPFVLLEIIVPQEYMAECMEFTEERRAVYRSTAMLGETRALIKYEMPLAEMIRDYFTNLKQLSRGYASMDYTKLDYRAGDLVKLEIDINRVTAHPLAQIVHKSRATDLGKKIVAVLEEEIPKQQIKVIIQARVGSMIVGSGSINPIRKDVLAKCYGGDITRKMKLLRKQADGKKKMQAIGKVNVPSDAIMAVIRKT